MKLKYKLPIYYIIIGIICISSFGYIAYNSKDFILNSIQINFNESAKSISYDIDLFLNEKIIDIKTLTKNNTIINTVEKNTDLLQEELNNYILINNSFNYIEISNDLGTVIGRSDVVQRGNTNNYYIVKEKGIGQNQDISINKDDKFFVSDIKYNEFKQPSINIIFSNIQIGDKKYNFVGNLKTDFIDQIVKNNYIGNKSNFSIVNNKGETNYKIDNTTIVLGVEVIIGEENSNGSGIYRGNYRKIIIKQSSIEAYENINYLWLLFTGLILFIVVSIIFLVIVIFKNFTSPLSRLLKTVKEISECDTIECNYSTRLDIDRNDELGFLATSFNKMLSNIKTNSKILNEYKGLIDESSLVSKYGKDGKITYVNDTFCEISTYPRDELIGKTMQIVKHPDTTDKVFEDVWNTINIKKIWKGTIKFKKKTGESYWASMIVAPILDVDNNIVEFISIGHDITELEQTKEELKGSYEKLKDSTTQLIEKERIGKEFELAEQIQNDFLPKLNEINIDGLDMHFGIKSATEIGGDLYDVINQKSDPNNVLFYIGDVTGHGLISGMMMAVCNTLVYGLANSFTNLVEILTILNSTLFYKLPEKVFITMLLLQYNKKEGTFSYLGAGHEKILIYRKEIDIVEEIKSGGDAIGMFKSTKRDLEISSIKLTQGDIILLYTDGITEARNKKGDFYGLEKLKESFKANAHRKTDVLYESLQKDLIDYIDDAEIVDDITMFLIKKN
ncbi:MAG: SpoIIE family protein phosphatase [Candidatus Gracilibacteria bacterium]